ncbi:hypothetical protein [Kribbella sp.]|uniref:hypothetical protein n=1 Tax=Kribbella sp. TaxID=1871183 RepID=UPI002D763F71|nr:hypothetical protein [Kribbella sp.]HZX02973.1 hypothetical protein [Kribbella sp.]
MTRVGHRRKKKRSRSAVSAGIVAGLALVAVFAFILTRGTTSGPTADGLQMGSGTDRGAAALTTTASGSATKADRKPPVSQTRPTVKATTLPPVNTGPESPRFKHGEWIAVLDKYPADAGDTAKATATKVTRAGIPAKAMLVNGQYPGLTDSSLAPVTGTWVVYLGPGTSSQQLLNLCQDPRTQAAYPSPCPTYEPAG